MYRNSHNKLAIALAVFLSFCMNACQKSSIGPTDPNYPTTFSRLDPSDYTNKLVAYWAQNPTVRSGLNTLGFCYSSINNRDLPYPADSVGLTMEEAYALARNFAAANPMETGVSDASALVFTDFFQFKAFSGYNVTYFRAREQMADSMEVSYATIGFRMENDHIVECTGNWYPNIYIPANFTFSVNEALHKLVGVDDGIWTWGGPVSKKITETDLTNADVSKCIYPLIFQDIRTELHVVYKINLSNAFNIYYLDVMDGKIIAEEPKFISK